MNKLIKIIFTIIICSYEKIGYLQNEKYSNKLERMSCI